MSIFSAEEMRKIMKRAELAKSIDSIYERFMNDIGIYLHEKFPMEPLDAIGEAAVCIGQRMIIANHDCLRVRDKEWQKIVRNYERKLSRTRTEDIKKRNAQWLDNAYEE